MLVRFKRKKEDSKEETLQDFCYYRISFDWKGRVKKATALYAASSKTFCTNLPKPQFVLASNVTSFEKV
jgi:hypothetical protein